MAKNLHNLSSVLASKSEKDDKDGLSAKKRSKIVKEAEHGHDFGKKDVKGKTGFKAVEEKADKEYGSKKAGEKVAGSIFWKERAKDAKK